MNDLLRAALVIARRDYVASVWSRTFLFFLVGPLLPIVFAVVFSGIGAKVDDRVTHPTVATIADEAGKAALLDAHGALTGRLGGGALPDLLIFAPEADRPAQTRALLADEKNPVVAVLTDPFGRPQLTGPEGALHDVEGDIALILDEARQRTALARAGAAPPPVRIALAPARQSAGSETTSRLFTARGAQTVLVFLTTLLAGMLLSNLIEEKSNKVIEVLAAAVPIDAIFLGKLIAMLGMSLTGIAIWGTMAATAVVTLLPNPAGLPPPAVGWPAFLALGIAYFTANYLLLGAVFIGIGAQASTVREVQTLSMPVTMGQLVVFAFASAAVASPGGPVAILATLFPWSSPSVMLAHAAQQPALWPHLLALAWQALWVALIIRFAARRFRANVLKSGGARRAFFARRGVKTGARTAT